MMQSTEVSFRVTRAEQTLTSESPTQPVVLRQDDELQIALDPQATDYKIW